MGAYRVRLLQPRGGSGIAAVDQSGGDPIGPELFQCGLEALELLPGKLIARPVLRHISGSKVGVHPVNDDISKTLDAVQQVLQLLPGFDTNSIHTGLNF